MPPEDDIAGLSSRLGHHPDSFGQLSTDHEGYADGDLEAVATRIEHQDQPARLVIIGGNNRGHEHLLGAGDNSIGRGLENTIVLADIAVSRKHTLICEENGQFIVRDLGSGNGTLVNGQRVQTHLLQEGDQLELGKTMLRFHASPAALAAAASNPGYAGLPSRPGFAGHYGEPALRGGLRGPIAPETQISETDARQRLPGLSPRSKRLLVFGGLLLVVLFGGLFVLRVVMTKKRAARTAAVAPTVSPDELAAQHFEEGTKQYRARKWEEARSHYLKVLAIAPGFDLAKRYADQAAAEIAARDAVQRTKAAIATKDFTSARKDLSQVPSTSSYATSVRALKQQLDDQQVQQLLESARLLEESGDRDGALDKVKEASRIAPTSEPVRGMHDRLTSKTTRARPARRPRPAGVAVKVGKPARRIHRPAPEAAPPTDGRPIRAGAGAKAALAHYRKKEWGPAYKSLKDHADTQSGQRKASADKLASAMRSVGQAVLRAEQVQIKDPAKALEQYLKALKLDRSVPGAPHQAWLKGQLQKLARFQATAAIQAGKHAQAYQAVKRWKKYGKPDAAMKRVLSQLEARAKELFARAYTVRQSNPPQARKLWQEVLKIVPPSSSAYQKSYSWLNSSAPRYQDEDED